ncbi:hypothetical protein PIB30_021145 [Stylosanthes scabra]|uniref:DNA repair metallo-beta-lactamase domain-containing protein n=1 Tax=Stylosanthes scabra TaxID=79078 RepID=A0ABU6R914_9FABA|nr:hypothetical protein [Stylosanthes scabra]
MAPSTATAGTSPPPPPLEEDPSPQHGDSYGVIDDPDILSLDDEGFPSQIPYEDAPPNAAGDTSGFAADFYRCGADWSSLLSPEDRRHSGGFDSAPSAKKLKQANLFQVWGFKRNGGVESDSASSIESCKPKRSDFFTGGGESVGCSERKIVKLENLGLILRDNGKKFEKSKSSHKRKESHEGVRVTRTCPFYKKIPGTSFTVDAFRYGCIEGCSAYFLSHFHSDHYGGLSKKWSHGPICCSPITGRLIQMCLSVNPLYIYPLEFNVEYEIDGVKVTLLEANHCPEDVLSYVVKVTKNQLKVHPKTLVVVGAYSIGKECVYLAISKALGVKIYANASRRRVLLAFDWSELSDSLCTNGNNTFLHVLPMSSLRMQSLKDYMKTYKEKYTAVLAFRPTGWTFSEKIRNNLELIKPISNGNITIYGVPYSEHSSFAELRDFVQFLRPDKIVPTVNVGNAATREKMQSYFRDWLKC